jgi:hypothetical protein
MRFGILIFAAAAAGGLVAVVIPPTSLQTASPAAQSFAGGNTVADLNPLRAAYDGEQAEINAVQTPQSMGSKPAPGSIPSIPTRQPSPGLANNSGLQNSQTTAWRIPPR